jgi:hypothetical protein
MSSDSKLAAVIRKFRAALERMPYGPERDQYLGRFLRMRERMIALPETVAAGAPFKTAADAQAALNAAWAHVADAISGAN